MKAIIINNEIKVFGQLPKTWKNHLNFRQASVELQQQEGFFDVVTPEYDSQKQYLGQILWDEANQVFTYPVIDRVFNLDELKASLHRDLDRVQNEFAVLISRCQIKHGYDNTDLNSTIEDARQMIATTETNIEALSTVDEALAFYIRPEDIEYYKSLFEPFK